jgi:hypothetical protein
MRPRLLQDLLEQKKDFRDVTYTISDIQLEETISYIESLEKKVKAGEELYTDASEAYAAYEVGVDEVSLNEALATYRKQVE